MEPSYPPYDEGSIPFTRSKRIRPNYPVQGADADQKSVEKSYTRAPQVCDGAGRHSDPPNKTVT